MPTAGASPNHWALRPRRIGIFGGSRISARNADFCVKLGNQLAGEDGLIIVSGGFKCFKDDPGRPSADWTIVTGALERLKRDRLRSKKRIETLLPEDDLPNIERFEAGETIILHHRTPQARRFALVNAADTLLTVEGDPGKHEMFDLALAFEKPVLPLCFTGGSAEEQWQANRDVVKTWFDLDEHAAANLEAVNLAHMTPEEMLELAQNVKRLLLHQLRRKCVVIMPFAEEYARCYGEAIKPAIESSGFTPVRSDELNLVGNVMEVLRAALNSAALAVAVITDSNPNVMYEVGLAHALGKPVILLCLAKPGREHFPDLPYDLRNEYVMGYGRDMGKLRRDITAALKQLKGGG